MNMKASSLFQTKPLERPLLGPKGRSEVLSKVHPVLCNLFNAFDAAIVALLESCAAAACLYLTPCYGRHPLCEELEKAAALLRQVALASFAFLFSEFVQYSQSRVSNIGELERRRVLKPRYRWLLIALAADCITQSC